MNRDQGSSQFHGSFWPRQIACAVGLSASQWTGKDATRFNIFIRTPCGDPENECVSSAVGDHVDAGTRQCPKLEWSSTNQPARTKALGATTGSVYSLQIECKATDQQEQIQSYERQILSQGMGSTSNVRARMLLGRLLRSSVATPRPTNTTAEKPGAGGHSACLSKWNLSARLDSGVKVKATLPDVVRALWLETLRRRR